MSKLPVSPSSAKPSSPLPLPLPSPALRSLGFTAPGVQPTAETSVQDLLLYALTLHATPRPDLDMVLVVAGELDAFCMFIEGPLHTAMASMARRLRASVDLAQRLEAA
jgi:hypothetical protein